MMTVTVNKRSRQVLIDIPTHQKIVPQRIEQALKEIGSDVIEEARRLITIGSKTGRVYNIAGSLHQASAPGEAPANLTGKLERSANYQVRNAQEMSVGESEAYAIFLENGTKKMAPRPHLIAAIHKRAGITYVTLENALRDL